MRRVSAASDLHRDLHRYVHRVWTSMRRAVIGAVAILLAAALATGIIWRRYQREKVVQDLLAGVGTWLEQKAAGDPVFHLGRGTIIQDGLANRDLFVVAVEAEHADVPIQLQLCFTNSRLSRPSTTGPAVIIAVYQTDTSSLSDAMAIYNSEISGRFTSLQPTQHDRIMLSFAYEGEAVGALIASQSLQWIEK